MNLVDHIRAWLGARPSPRAAFSAALQTLETPTSTRETFTSFRARLQDRVLNAQKSVEHDKMRGQSKTDPARWRDEIFRSLWWIARDAGDEHADLFDADYPAFCEAFTAAYRAEVDRRIAPAITIWDKYTEQVIEQVTYVHVIALAPDNA